MKAQIQLGAAVKLIITCRVKIDCVMYRFREQTSLRYASDASVLAILQQYLPIDIGQKDTRSVEETHDAYCSRGKSVWTTGTL